MKKSVIECAGARFPLYSLNTLVVGSAVAALNAAVQLFKKGQKDIAIATDEWGGGTSNNAGSDKQTYYRLSLSGDLPDSPLEMAKDLFQGGCMHGDIAFCEAMNSVEAFFHLVSLGVPFPHDQYGAYVGYKTDHDPRGRGTSAGPLTSQKMFECLGKEVQNRGIMVFDRHEVIALLTEKRGDEKHDMGKLAKAIFLKGYQWPFDPRKVANHGSSLIDILVYQEIVKNKRRVFLDFTRNPSGGSVLEDFSLNLLDEEAYAYLEKSGALLDTPIERLARMNRLAIELFKSYNIDIAKEYLEIAVCAQHNNGGLKGNIWWESNIKHLFPVGEVNGTHGVYRPGGSALNSGQVGSMRAAAYISKRYNTDPPNTERFMASAESQIKKKFEFAQQIINQNVKDNSFLDSIRREIQERMSSCGTHIRNSRKIKDAFAEAWNPYSRLKNEMKIPRARELPLAFKNLDLCLTHALYLEAIAEYLEKGGKSRGSYLVLDSEGEKPCDKLGDEWTFRLNKKDSFVDERILEIYLDEDSNIKKQWVEVRPVPKEDVWFENVWNKYLKDNIIK